jgi:Tfp pilus assembly protein PilO
MRERRLVVVPLLVALAINVVLYAGVVYPLSQRVANIEERDRNAEENLLAAQRDHAQAAGTLEGRDRAATELAAFYTNVLPTDLSGARRLTHLRLAQLARESNLKFIHASFEPVAERNRTLTRLQIEMALSGTYDDMRDFIRDLETSDDFVVIDNLELGEGADGGPLSVTVRLSTYYRDPAAGSAPR